MNLAGLTDVQLEELHQQCTEVIESVLSRLESDGRLQDAVRQLVQAADMLQVFNDLQSQLSESTGLALQVAVAVLVNTQSRNAIDADRHRRAIERN